ncbi:hypothetical protein SAMN05444414_104186 [Roseovarius marisflavi]|uniref:Biofilm-associated protein BapA-like prefix-like domain-containing protein n=1 Tax=Roseovarius marisflavi TaxID=1054996 RepID=A0A1M6XLK4_9RHOB|nr:hypothetical protein [Roseovarius marisflavi]SHL06854.1 hypothetical protein SAMN05444414_104186 [Roseovarius marisflavi]
MTVIPADQGQEISLNLRQTDIQGYSRDGGDLVITLSDGRMIVLDNYYGDAGAAQSRLFISADGYLNEVSLIEGTEGTVYAQYGPTEQWGKWSPTEDLIFLSGNEITTPVGGDDEVSMLGAGILAGGSLLGLGGAGAAGLAAAAVIGAGTGGGGSGGAATRIPPSVNEDGTITIGGDDAEDPTITITGGGEPGSDVGVTIGDQTVDTVVDENGEWDVAFEGDTFPEDGEHVAVVVVTEPDGAETTLDGLPIMIDTTPPEVSVEEGTVATDHVVNAEDYDDGVDIAGQGVPGASITVVVDGLEQSTVIGEDGQWKVTFDPADLAGGEREAEVTITATDSFGNSTTVTDALSIDTVPHPIAINGAAIGGDGVLNFAELDAGYQVSGTSTAGATVRVTLEGIEQDVIVGENGTWTAQFESQSIAGGTREATVTASTFDAAGNPSQTTGTFHIDTEVRDFAMSGNAGGDDSVINAVEQNGGFTMSGQVEPDSSVVVTFRGAEVDAVVDANGSWTAYFTGAQIPAGTYSADVVAIATDAANNTSEELRQTITVDTEAGSLTLNAASIGGNGVINGDEANAGVLVTGTADPGARVIVTLDGVEHTAMANNSGQWQSLYRSQEITRGTHDPLVTAYTEDAAGNPAEVEATVRVDTQVDNLNLNDLNLAITADGRDVINNDVATGGFSVTGTIEPGSQVTVTVDGVEHDATVDSADNWVAVFGANEIVSGQRFANLRVDVIDPAGNEAFLTDTVQTDTFVDELSLQGPITADNVVNIAEAQGGLQLSGRVEAGSSATIDVFGRTYDAAVDGAGNWTLTIPQGDIPLEEGSTQMVINATD